MEFYFKLGDINYLGSSPGGNYVNFWKRWYVFPFDIVLYDDESTPSATFMFFNILQYYNIIIIKIIN